MNANPRSAKKAAALFILLSATVFFAKQPDTLYTVRIDPGSRTMNVRAEMTLEDEVLSVAPIGANQFENR
ncbi:MAG: hypothetical protein J5I65_02355 [Aridibacter famidurans]|nr:hypothetical protein [Aridibacter famidurans]